MSITHIAIKTGDSTLWTVQQMLEDAVNDVESGKVKANKALVLFLEDEDKQYNVKWTQSGFKMSEILSLLKVSETMVLEEMGY